MPVHLIIPLAAIGPSGASSARPIFGSLPLALLAVVGGIVVFLALVALLGRWLAATHPAAQTQPVAEPDSATNIAAGLAPEVTAVIAAAIVTTLGARARIAAVRLASAPVVPSVEMLMQQWSMEGRRQIYSSHKVR